MRKFIFFFATLSVAVIVYLLFYGACVPQAMVTTISCIEGMNCPRVCTATDLSLYGVGAIIFVGLAIVLSVKLLRRMTSAEAIEASTRLKQ